MEICLFILLSCFFKILSLLKSGPNSVSKEYWGVNYRALNDLFDISRNRRNTFSYEVGVQMVEIYNEQVRDLLSNDGSQKRYPSMCIFLFIFCFPNLLLFLMKIIQDSICGIISEYIWKIDVQLMKRNPHYFF